MAPAEDELAVIARAVVGDVRALEDLLVAYHPRLLQYVARRLPESARSGIDPMDILQDTYFAASQQITSFRPMGANSMFRWLATIARRRIIDFMRTHQPGRGTGHAAGKADDAWVTGLLEELAIYKRTPSGSAAFHELLAMLEQAIERLPPMYRQAVTLRHLQGLSVSETAARMSRTEDAVSWLCCRAMRVIRDDLRSASRFI